MPRFLSVLRTSGLRTSRRLGLALALPGLTLPGFTPIGGAAPARAQEAAPDVHALFVSNCAQCHGETGDGQGTTTLDRPARSFKDGGFSYGNTPEALFRTISMGIPGTPMPAFDSALDEAKRRALAEYVITLGPEIREVKEEDMVLVVRDRPLVVRGKLPPIAEGALEHPRGLLIGTTDGFTFEYAADDVRLLGVRQGDFVRRSDWVGRGGTGLEPLGKVVCLVEHGLPGATFVEGEDARPLRAHLESTQIAGGTPRIQYSLLDATGTVRAQVREALRVSMTSFGAAFVRRVEVQCGATPLELAIVSPAPRTYSTTPGVETLLGTGARPDRIQSVSRKGDAVLCTTIVHPMSDLRHVDMTRWRATLAPQKSTWAEIALLPLGDYTEEIGGRLLEMPIR